MLTTQSPIPTPKSRLADFALLTLALAGGGATIYALRQPWALDPAWNWLWYALIAAGLLGGLALVRMERWLPDGQLPAKIADFPPVGRQVAGLLVLVGASAITVWIAKTLWPAYRFNWPGTVWPWAVSLVLALAAGWLLHALGRPAVDDANVRLRVNDPTPTLTLSPRWELIAFGLILALAVFLRLYRLGEIPTGIYVDETNGALDALYILQGRATSPFGVGWYETPSGYTYYMAALFKWFGATFGALKAASLIPAILTVPAVYLLARQMFGPITGLLAMTFMASSRWHLTMSRWGWNETAPPLFQVLATFFLLRGLCERRALDYAAGGLITGLVVYTYLSSRLAVATLGLFAIYWLLSDPEGPIRSWQRHWRGFGVFLIASLIAVTPILTTYITDPFTFNNRASEISIFVEVAQKESYQPLIDNVKDHLKFFHQAGDRHGKHNLPSEPQTDPITGLLFVVGLGYGLLRLRDRRRGLLWMWLLFAMIGGILSVRHESPQAYRTLTAIPAISILAADVLYRAGAGLAGIRERGFGEKKRRFGVWGVLGLLVVIGGSGAAAAWESTVYFGRQADSEAVQVSFNLTENWVTKEVQTALADGTTLYLSPRFYTFSPLRFLIWGDQMQATGAADLDSPPYNRVRPEVDLPVPDPGGAVLFLVDSYYWPLADYFRLYYPNASVDLIRGPGNAPLYMRVMVPESDTAAIQGLRMTVTLSDGSSTTTTVSSPNQNWEERTDVTTVAWAGSLRIPASGAYEFVLPPGLLLALDSVPWTGSRYLASGLHTFSAQMANPEAQPTAAELVWRRPDPTQGMVQEAVPASAFFQIQPPQQGLLATYYAGESWSGPPLFQQVTPFLLLAWSPEGPFAGSFSARFTGSLRMDSPGPVRFRLDADDGVRFIVDGQIVAEALTPDQPNQVIVSLDLAVGEHPIQIDYFQRGGGNALEFYWQPMGLPESPVPPSVLTPTEPGQ